jgi:hypothetical protein
MKASQMQQKFAALRISLVKISVGLHFLLTWETEMEPSSTHFSGRGLDGRYAEPVRQGTFSGASDNKMKNLDWHPPLWSLLCNLYTDLLLLRLNQYHSASDSTMKNFAIWSKTVVKDTAMMVSTPPKWHNTVKDGA